ncbi:MAG: rRNA maturation RNase YbeY [Planctomycetaceae bacterium]|jgi:probable rRNA maturation factor|nr:rRNA maturation RNase YbeY [Planctomycetaceae bacterium]MBT4012576.1 rRNA maturation RNase YbeY [Planctomycetaceae bacterium]MBT4724534.1 rRNA maturation RNase YbeY [Planctomycetaceae bacterium]MBT4846289.1 rRNA maturation RNase YbeY [Planctomycetaceae bacterium]MBT5125128.1 rRNA maturation RNase YbeY [Planctomycetaceae bacterium]
MIKVLITNEQSQHEFDCEQLRAAVLGVVDEAEIGKGEVSLAIVDDETIHALNVQYLQHDYPTDVISFVLEQAAGHLEGEVIVSAEMAATVAQEYGWSTQHELLLYVIHGTLHLVGYDDKDPQKKIEMQAAERRHLRQFSIEHRT